MTPPTTSRERSPTRPGTGTSALCTSTRVGATDDPRPSWPPRDWTVVSISGRGVYAGTLLEISNSSKAWWGEGDEKIWVDDEDFPSHFGTGTEDYFGYAWSTPVPFARPYHSQTLAEGPGGYGSFSMNRWHVLDPIPFTRRLIFDQEIWHWSKTASLSLAAVAFFYADLDATTNAEAPRPGEAVLQLAPPLPKKTVRGALEAERMETQTSDGRAEPQRMVPLPGRLLERRHATALARRETGRDARPTLCR